MPAMVTKTGKCTEAVYAAVVARAKEDGLENFNGAMVMLLARYGEDEINVSAMPAHDLAKVVAHRLQTVVDVLDREPSDVIEVARMRELLVDVVPEALVEQLGELERGHEGPRSIRCPGEVWDKAVARHKADGFANMSELFSALATWYAAGFVHVTREPARGMSTTLTGRVETVLWALNGVGENLVDLVDLRGQLNDVHPDVLARELGVMRGNGRVQLTEWHGDEQIPDRIKAGALVVEGKECHQVRLLAA